MKEPGGDRKFETHIFASDRMGEAEGTGMETKTMETTLLRAVFTVA